MEMVYDFLHLIGIGCDVKFVYCRGCIIMALLRVVVVLMLVLLRSSSIVLVCCLVFFCGKVYTDGEES